METKICSKCGRELPLDRFESGRNQCRDCRNARRKELREKIQKSIVQNPRIDKKVRLSGYTL